MQFENQGIRIWYGTEDAPGPAEIVPEGAALRLVIGVAPPNPRNIVWLTYRVGKGPAFRKRGQRFRLTGDAEYFRADFGPLRAGRDLVQYGVVCECGGRQVPRAVASHHMPSSFRVVRSAEAPSAARGTGRRGALGVSAAATSVTSPESGARAKTSPAVSTVGPVEAGTTMKAAKIAGLPTDEPGEVVASTEEVRSNVDPREVPVEIRARDGVAAGRTPQKPGGDVSPLSAERISPSTPPPSALSTESRRAPRGGASHSLSGSVVLPPGWGAGVVIEAFADEELSERVGEARTDAEGRFHLEFSDRPTRLWFRWSYKDERGRTPILQPWRLGSPLHIHVHAESSDEGRGRATHEGVVRTDAERPVPGVRVWLVEVALRRCRVLGRSVTREDGSFRLPYRQDALIAEASPDLRILVFNENEVPLFESREAVVVLPAESIAAPSLYDHVHRRISELLGESERDSERKLTPEDLAYVAERTSLPIATLLNYANASALGESFGIDGASAFALAESKMMGAPQEALKEAVRRGVAPRSVLRGAPETEAAVMRAIEVEATKLDLGRGSVEDVLSIRVADAETRSALGARLLRRQDDISTLCRELEEDDTLTPGLRFLLEAHDTIGTDAPLARALSREFDKNEVRSAGDLATWTTSKWEAWLRGAGVETPPLFTRSDAPEEGVRDYARHLQRRFERRFANRAFRAHIDRNAQAYPWGGEVRDFLGRHPEFDFSMPVREFAAKGARAFDGGTGKRVESALRTMQRLASVTRSLSPVRQLVDAGFRSASSIASIGPEEFIRRFTPAFDGSAVDAAAAYTRAKRKTALARYTHSVLSNDFHRSGITALTDPGPSPEEKTRAIEALGLASEAELDVTWQRLFGSSELSFCECAHCKSVFGPAAYLFDMLLFLRGFTAGADEGELPLLVHLAARRPDVPRLRLSCDNTNIEVPHIDLVNELLGDLIASALPEPGEAIEDDHTCDDGATPEPPRPIECVGPMTETAPASHADAPSGKVLEARELEFSPRRGLQVDPCLPPNRETVGTSAERRAFPQNEPLPMVVSRLSSAAYPWVLPYDYAQDRARSARGALPVRAEDLALTVWRFTVAAPNGSPEEATRVLAAHLLDLSEAERGLLTKPPRSLAKVWGPEVSGAVMAGTGPSVAALLRAGGMDYLTLEAALDSHFVRGTDLDAEGPFTLEPQASCDIHEIRLVGDRSTLCGVLDRMHRFERLRRHLGWSSHQLDEALRWVGTGLDERALEQLGILRFLELRLEVSPDALLALFRDPDAARPATLRPRDALSPFEILFGSAPFELPDPDDYDVDDEELSDLVVAQIAQRVGEPWDAIHFAFERGFIGSLADPAALVRSSDPDDAFRQAVSGAFRVATWAAKLRVSLSELVDLIELGRLEPMPRHGGALDPMEQLRDAVDLVDFADRADDWPVDIGEARYVVTSSAEAARAHAPTARQLGLELLELHREVATARSTEKEAPADVFAALRDHLSELLNEARLKDSGEDPVPESLVDRVTRLFEWSIFYPDLEAEARRLLPAAATEGWDALLPLDAGELAGAASAWSDALDSLQEALEEWLQQEFVARASAGTAETDGDAADEDTESAPVEMDEDAAGGDTDEAFALADGDPNVDGRWSTPVFLAGVQALQELVVQIVKDPARGDQTALADALRSFLTAYATEELDEAAVNSLAVRYRDAALDLVAARLETWRRRSARRIRPMLESTLRRLRIDRLVVEWVVRNRFVGERQAELLLDLLEDPLNAGQPLLRAFVAEDGSTPRLDESLPIAQYLQTPGDGPTPDPTSDLVQAVRERREPALYFDWSELPPPAGVDPERFEVTVSAIVPTDRVREDGIPRRLVVETNGRAVVRIRAGELEQIILDVDSAGEVGQHDVDQASLDTFLTALGSSPPSVVSIDLQYVAPEAAGPRVMRLLAAASDGKLDDLRPGTLTEAVLRLEKAARLLREVGIPLAAWRPLAAIENPAHRIDLNALPVDDGEWLRAWLRLVSLDDLWKRHGDKDALARWLALVTGGSVALSELPSLLDLTPQELTGVLQLLGLEVDEEKVSFAENVAPMYLAVALNLADRARRVGLPVRALARWNDASPDETYHWSLAAFRSKRPLEEWLEVVAEIHDPIREHLRDAQVAWLVTHERRGRDGTAPPFVSPEAISDYLFTDTQMSSCMPTSRIQFSYAAVQRYIDAARLGYEVGPEQGAQEERFEREWDWRRSYRLWEANRRVFVHPENWLEPDVRPDKTDLFQKFEHDLLAGPLTSESAERALAGYVSGLVEIARPEIVAMVHQEELADFDSPLGFRDPDLRGTHVFARSRTQPHQLFYRRKHPAPDGRWTPWERIDVELEGTHYLAVVAFGRLRLICAEMAAAADPRQDECDPNEAQEAVPKYEMSLAWIDRQHGQWSAVSRSGRFEFTVPLTDLPTDDELWENFPDTQYPEAQIDPTDRIKKICVKLYHGPDGINPGSEIVIKLVDPEGDGDQKIGSFKPEYDGYTRWNDITRCTSILDRIDPEKISQIKLTWNPRTDVFKYDDVRFYRIEVRFKDANEVVVDEMRVSSGRVGPDFAPGSNDSSVDLPFTMWSGHDELLGEPNNTEFTGDLERKINLGVLNPQEIRSRFDIDFDLLPRSVDLSQSIRIEARQADADSLAIEVHSNESIRVGRIRPRFKLQSNVIDDYPEVEDRWPLDWVSGDEMCFNYTTIPQHLTTLHVFPDGSVSDLESRPAPDPGSHPGARAEGQQFLSRPTKDGDHLIYCGEHLVAVAPGLYQLVVRRDDIVSGHSNPKLLDEVSSASSGRTFFIERIGEAGPTLATSSDGFECVQIPFFGSNLPPLASGWPVGLLPRGPRPDPLINIAHGATGPDPLINLSHGTETSGPLVNLVHGAAPLASIISLAHGAISVSGERAEGPLRGPRGSLVSGTEVSRSAEVAAKLGSAPKAVLDPHSGFPSDVPIEIGDLVSLDFSGEPPIVGVTTLCVPSSPSLKFYEFLTRVSWSATSTEGAASTAAWAFRVFWHPQATGFLRVLESRGTPRLLRIANQTLAADSDLERESESARVDFFGGYEPTSAIDPDWPRAEVDFSVTGAYADYNWELFFHAPLLIAQRLSEAGQFDDAERWFRFLFDPTKQRPGGPAAEVFQTAPIRDAPVERVQDMLDLLVKGTLSQDLVDQVERMNMYPYQPHLIARSRRSAYAMAVVMRYLDHLIRWGDMLFRRAYGGDNRTDLEAASSRYDLAVRLLGRRPGALPERGSRPASCFADISVNVVAEGSADETETEPELWDPVIGLEDFLPDQLVSFGRLSNDGVGVPELYFCVPNNDKIEEYWNTLAGRLTNLRSCQDIEGVRRAISLYGRRIDPGLLVRATALGVDLDVLLGRLSAPLPKFRFQSLVGRAMSACERARSFGDVLLSTLEKRDAEELGRLRNKHEIDLLEAGRDIRSEQLKEAKASLVSLVRSKESAEMRREYYATRDKVSPGEKAEDRALEAAGSADNRAATDARTASDWAWVPSIDFFAEAGAQYPLQGQPPSGPMAGFARAGAGSRYTLGGETLVQVHRNNAEAHSQDAAAARVRAGQLGRHAGFDRRWEEWQHQESLAAKDIQQLDRQVTAAEIRVRIAELERDTQRNQLDNAKVVDAYLRDKFTNAQLYRWIESRLTHLHYQQYRLAYDLASFAQAALVRELGLEDQPPLPDTWDPAHRGLGAAADLLHELEKLQRQYVDGWRREHEKTKHYSLAERHPLALLELRQRGECTFQIREHELDEDEPGDYFRRIRSVSLDIPCVRGPYSSVNARLTLLRSEIRARAHASPEADDYAREEGLEGANDPRFRDDPGGLDHIVTSTGVADDGLFDAGNDGEARRPFEGAGMISTWRLELRPATNHFDRTTVSDVSLRFQYTGRAGGDLAAAAALSARSARLEDQPDVVMLSLDTLSAGDWHRFVAGGPNGHELRLQFEDSQVPYRLQPVGRIVGTDLYFELPQDEDLRIEGGTAIGEISEPHMFTPPEDDRRAPLPIRRLRLQQPLRLGEERRIKLLSNSDVPRRGWLACWVQVER